MTFLYLETQAKLSYRVLWGGQCLAFHEKTFFEMVFGCYLAVLFACGIRCDFEDPVF